MKKLSILVALAVLLALGGQAFGEMCTIDAVPAATLLLPYFEVDLENADGPTTLFSINNASAAPTLAHVTIWSNWTVPVIDFDVFLTGYDVQTINLRNIFVDGNLPVTAHATNDPLDAISPHQGEWSDNPCWDSDPDCTANPDFASCDDFFPFDEPALGATLLDRVQNGLTGQPLALGSAAGDCLGEAVDSGYAVGYVTVDNVNVCNTQFPPENDPDLYFDHGDPTAIANNLNYLWGDWFIIDSANNFAQGDNLVHIEADNGFDSGETDSGYTFYGRWWGAGDSLWDADGADNREPLGLTWGARYINGAQFEPGGTDYLVWRDSTYNGLALNGYDCDDGPGWAPMNEEQLLAFNEAEDVVSLCYYTSEPGGVISPPEEGTEDDPACFPLETNRVDTEELGTPFTFGWMYLDLNPGTDSFLGDWDPTPDGEYEYELAQSYVIALHSAFGRYSVGLSAIELISACDTCGDGCEIVGEIEQGPLP